MQYVISIDGNSSLEPTDVGGKAAALNHLKSKAINVPNALVITTKAFEQFLVVNDLMEEIHQELTTLTTQAAYRVSQRISQTILKGGELDFLRNALRSEMLNLHGDSFAVRSSAVVEDGAERSWAGLFNTSLFVASNMDDLLAAVLNCWASLFSSRAINYSRETFSGGKLPLMAVIVQEMVSGDASGVVFTQSPDGDEAGMLVEAAQGSGEKIVAGQVIPTSVRASRDSSTPVIMPPDAGSNFPLNKKVLENIVSTALEIEGIFGCPVDVEWTVESEVLHVLQARPITTKEFDAPRMQNGVSLNILDYEMTFKVTGLSFLFTDVLNLGFKYLDPLFVCANGEFKQYFTNEKMAYAASYGYEWLSKKDGFSAYRAEFEAFHITSNSRLKALIQSTAFDATTLNEILRTFGGLMERYSKMDFQFTNLTFHRAFENDVLEANLEALEEFKDHAREWVNAFLLEEESHFAKLLDRLAAVTGVSVDALNNYSASELEALITNRQKVDELILKDRESAFLIFHLDNETRHLAGEEALRFAEYVNSVERVEDGSSVAGQVANRTNERIVEGPARVINVDYGDFEKMEKEMIAMMDGEILISEFTAPELLPACQKAKAVVTDLGGMLSHAAIVCRELGKPCIVGTRNASRTFQDGDVVLLDLETGTVGKATEC